MLSATLRADGSHRFPLKAGPSGTQGHREKMTQLTIPPPYIGAANPSLNS